MKEGEVLIRNGTLFVPVFSGARFAYLESPRMILTPGVSLLSIGQLLSI